MAATFDPDEVLGRPCEREQFLREADGDDLVFGSVNDQERRNDARDAQVAPEGVAHQGAKRQGADWLFPLCASTVGSQRLLCKNAFRHKPWPAGLPGQS